MLAGLLLLLIITLSSTPQVAAYSSDAQLLSITDASYCDLDGDGYEDDVLTILRIGTPNGYPAFIFCWLSLTLTLPSGRVSYVDTFIFGIYSSLVIRVEWYDHAIESGLYTLDADMTAVSTLWSVSAYAQVIFDPPDEGPPGTPWVNVMI